MKEFQVVGTEAARPFFVSTTVSVDDGGGSTNQTVASATGLAIGQSIHFATTNADRTITNIVGSVLTLNSTINTTNGETVTVNADSSQYAIFKRVVMPENGFIYGLGVEMNGLLTGTNAEINMNLGCFSAKTNTGKSPDSLIHTNLQGVLTWTSAGVVGYSSRNWQQLLFPDYAWVAKGTHFWVGGPWRTHGASPTAGGLNGVSTAYYGAAVSSAAGNRGSLRTSLVVAYTAGSLATFIADYQTVATGSYPTGWTNVTTNGGNQDCLADMNVAILYHATK
jgi:hypothetical protein